MTKNELAKIFEGVTVDSYTNAKTVKVRTIVGETEAREMLAKAGIDGIVKTVEVHRGGGLRPLTYTDVIVKR